MELMPLVVIFTSFYIAWNIGANDTANAVGVTIGTRILTFRKAVVFLAVFVFVGAMMEGYKIMHPIGSGLVTSPQGFASPFKQLPVIVVISLFCAGIFVTAATILGMPVSTHHAILGALAGGGIAANVFSSISAEVNWTLFLPMLGSWIISPISAGVFAIFLYRGFEIPYRQTSNAKLWESFFGVSAVVSGCYIAYVMGANDVGTAMGALHATEAFGPGFSASTLPFTLLGAVGIVAGALTFSRRVIGTVGQGITELNKMTAFAAQTGAALSVGLFTLLGIPVSTSQAVVGGVVGVGILRGVSAVRFRTLGGITLSWVATPLVSIFISFVATALFLLATPQETGGISGYSSGYQYRDTQDVLSLVQDAADLVANQGEMAFENFRRDHSKWSHGDTYVFILDSEGNMILHPDQALQGKNLIGLLDVNRKPIIRGLIDRAQSEKKEGWYHYQWPEPKSGQSIWKSSFVKLAVAPSGKQYVVGSGLYNTKMEKEFIVELVDAAVSLIEKEGERAFPAFRDKAGPFIFLDTYILVNDLDGVELVNAGFPRLEGRNLMGERDANGDFIMRKFIEKALNEDGGWVDYLWPKPGQVVPAKKYTYVRKARYGDKTYIVGAGVYLK